MKERFHRVLRKKSVDKIPVCSVTQTGTLELMEKTGTSWPKAHYDSIEMAKLSKAGHTVLGFEAVRYPFSSFDIPTSFGCKYSEGTFNSQPHMLDFPVKEVSDVKDISFPENFFEQNAVKTITNTTEILTNDPDLDDCPLIVGIIGPASIASCIAGINNYLVWTITEPDALRSLMEVGADVCIEYSNRLYDLGVDSVVIIDSEGVPDLVAPSFFESAILPVHKRMNKKIKKPTILHICGDATMILDSIKTAGFKGVNIEEKVRIKDAADIMGDDICIIGNISPAHDLLFKSPEYVYEQSIKCMEEKVDILAPGCGLAPATPSENVEAMIKARDDYC
ncbi:MAG: MtaA/CmuA family methyltransferase [Methanosarcinaceae archaeon]|nr:MtaA/CmuA family methyltransferase [Methanosarcinaceae archaeon]